MESWVGPIVASNRSGIFLLAFFKYFIIIGPGIAECVLLRLMGSPRYHYRIEDWQEPHNQYHPIETASQLASERMILLDTHFHTKFSDGWLTVEEAVHWHLAMGFTAFFITDHNTMKGCENLESLQAKYKDQCLILPGIELDGPLGHFNLLGIQTWDGAKWGKPRDETSLRAIINEVHRLGGVITVNHFPWSIGGKKPRFDPKVHITMEQAAAWGIDLMEVANWDDDISPIDTVAHQFCKNHSEIGPIVGTDVHAPDKDRIYGWTVIKTADFTPNAVMKALRSHQTDVILREGGVAYPTTHKPTLWFTLLKPLYMIGDLFISLHRGGSVSNVDWKTVFLWILFIFNLFLIIFFVF
jgi:hypothetical protein